MKSESGSAEIVLIEDDERQAELIRLGLLADLPEARVRIAATGGNGFDLVSSDPPHVVLLDYDLPDMNGLDVYRKILDRQIASRVIFVTGHSTPDVAVEAMKLGAHDFVTKETGFVARVARSIRSALAALTERPTPRTTDAPLRRLVQGFERGVITERLGRFRGRRAATARSLGITREGLYMKMIRYGLQKKSRDRMGS